MPGAESRFASVTHYIRNLRGGSQPILAGASDGQVYVVKFANNLQGTNLSFNESAGNELYRACGLAEPSWKPLLVTDSFIDRNPDCWMQTPEGPLRPVPGLCFGSRFLGGGSKRLLEILPGTSLIRVANHKSFWMAWMIDICARHADNRQAIFLQDLHGGLKAFFIDHGHLFGGPKGGLQQHFTASRYLDPRIYESVSSHYLLNLQRVAMCLDAERLRKRILGLPNEWKTASALDGFTQCLDRLSNPSLLHNIVDTMVDAIHKANGLESSKYRPARPHSVGVLCSGVQVEGLGRSLVGRRTRSCPCAQEAGRKSALSYPSGIAHDCSW